MNAREERNIKKQVTNAAAPQKLSGMDKKIVNKLAKQVSDLEKRVADLEEVLKEPEVAIGS